MDEQRDEVRFEQVSPKGVSRTVPVVTFLIGIFLGAAVFKPWDLIFPPNTTPVDRNSPVFAVATPTPADVATTEPSPTPAASSGPVECAFAGGWRIFALGLRDALGGDGSTTGGQPSSEPAPDFSNPLRRWLEVIPLDTVSGPADPAIPFVTIVSSRTTAVGFCPPPEGTDGPPASTMFHAWYIDPTGRPLSVGLLPVSPKGSVATEVGVYIGEPDFMAGLWSPGRYVFAVETPDGRYQRWFGLEIRTPPGRPTD